MDANYCTVRCDHAFIKSSTRDLSLRPQYSLGNEYLSVLHHCSKNNTHFSACPSRAVRDGFQGLGVAIVRRTGERQLLQCVPTPNAVSRPLILPSKKEPHPILRVRLPCRHVVISEHASWYQVATARAHKAVLRSMACQVLS